MHLQLGCECESKHISILRGKSMHLVSSVKDIKQRTRMEPCETTDKADQVEPKTTARSVWSERNDSNTAGVVP